MKEQKKYILKFGSLSEEKIDIAKDQKINKEILKSVKINLKTFDEISKLPTAPLNFFGLGSGSSFTFTVNDFDEIFSNISKLNIRVICTASVVYFVSVYFRYLRWKLIYKELIGNYKFNMLKETIVGYMANNIFPFRLGELYLSLIHI